MMKENNMPRFLSNGVILARRPRILKIKPLFYSQNHEPKSMENEVAYILLDISDMNMVIVQSVPPPAKPLRNRAIKI